MRETNINQYIPNQGPNPQLGHVPRLGIKPSDLSVHRLMLNQLNHTGRPPVVISLYDNLREK